MQNMPFTGLFFLRAATQTHGGPRISDRAHAAVDHPFGDRHETAFIGRQADSRMRDVVRLAGTPSVER
ncbi:MAG: hypothetical protein KH616_03150 [Burkholderia sp.]|nr:hypothetical protein [Burkholderia sp.]